MDWFWTRNSIRSSVTSGKKNKHSSSTRRTTSRRRWCDRILETERWSSEQIWALSILVWWFMEEQDGRKRRQQEKISILYWLVRTRNSSPSSSPRPFRTQSQWSFTTGQCIDSEQFLQVHLSYWMCGQFTLHHKFRIDTGRTKFKQRKDRRCSLRLWIPWIRITKIRMSLIWLNHVLHLTSKSGKCTKIRCTGSIFSLLNEKDWNSIKQDRTQSSSTIHSQLIVSRNQLWWNLKKSYTRKCMCHLDHRRRFPKKIIGREIWILMLQEAVKTCNESS